MFLQEVKYALRALMNSPGYAAAAVLSLALGIGANSAIFTLTNAVFLHPLAVKDVSRILELYTVDHATKTTAISPIRTPVSYPNFVDLRQQNDTFQGMSAFTQTDLTLTGFTKPSQENVFLVSANYFDILGVKPVSGRTFRPDEDTVPGGNPLAVLSDTISRRLFGSERNALGRTINLNSVAYEVIGVAPPGFKGTLTIGPPDAVWIPLSMHTRVFSGPIERFFNERRFRFLNVFGRMRPGVSEDQAQANLVAVAASLEKAYLKDNKGRTVETAPLAQAALGFIPRGKTSAAAIALTAAVGFVLLIACANIANLSLARATKRSRELGIRIALGAGRGQLIRQLLTEAEILALVGGLAGMLLGWFGARALWTFRPGFLAQNDVALRLEPRVWAFTLGVSLITGLLFGLAPILRASMPDLSRVLNLGGRGNIQGGSRNRLRSLLVVAEMALALIALAGAGLFVRSMQQAQKINLGFETRDLAIFGFDLGAEQMTPDRGRQFLRSVVEKARQVPGVAAAAVAANAPLTAGFFQTAFREGDPVDSRLGTLALTLPVSPEYMETMRIPFVEGRAFNQFDKQDSKHVIIVSEAMARSMWGRQEPLGKRFRFATGTNTYEVVGVTKNTAAVAIGEPPQPVAYLPLDQSYEPAVVVHIRSSVPPERVLPAAMAAVQSLDTNLALVQPATMQTVIGQALWAPRMAAALFGLFGLLAMALAIVGVYGVMAYVVLQRTSEIGIRMAMGARPRDVIRMVVGQSMRMAVAGIAIGALAALFLTRLIGNLLFDVSPNDPLTFGTVTVILAATALLAGGIPAWRAARIDPLTALREE